MAKTKRRHERNLEFTFSRPVSGNLPWRDMEALVVELKAEVSERAGGRVAIMLPMEVSQGLSQSTSIH